MSKRSLPTQGSELPGAMPLGFHRHHPGGMPENSPAFQRRGKFRMAQVPQGRLNGWHVIRQLQYLKGQEEHHRQMTFQEEYLALLKKHRIEHPNRFEQLLYRAVSCLLYTS